MTELDLVRLRELAAELGFWPATTSHCCAIDQNHSLVCRFSLLNPRYPTPDPVGEPT
jgi:hypothetical protein